MLSTTNLKFVFIIPKSDICQKYFAKFANTLKLKGFLTSILDISEINTLNSETSFFYSRVFITHNPTIVDIVKNFRIKGTDILVQFLTETDKIVDPEQLSWPYQQTLVNLEKLYPNVFGLDISQDVDLYPAKERLTCKTDHIFRICGGGLNLNTFEPISFYPKYNENDLKKLKFDVGLIISQRVENFENVRTILHKHYDNRFTLIDNLSKIRRCKVIVVLASDNEKLECRYPDELYSLALYNVPIVTNVLAPPFTDALQCSVFFSDTMLLSVINNILYKYTNFIDATEKILSVISQGFNLDIQILKFAQWLRQHTSNTVFSVEHINHKVSNLKHSLIANTEYNDIKDIFDKIYVINLKRDVEKLKKVENILKVAGISGYKVFNAIDGTEHKDILAQIQLEYICKGGEKSDYHMIQTCGELGCLLSHLAILQEAKEMGYRSILIFEDDVILCKNFVKKFVYHYLKLYKPWDILYLGCSKVEFYADKNYVSSGFTTIDNAYGTFAYAVKDTGYDAIIHKLSNLQRPIDMYYAKELSPDPKFRAIVCNPFLAIADTSVSSIRDSVSLDVSAKLYDWNLEDFPIEDEQEKERDVEDRDVDDRDVEDRDVEDRDVDDRDVDDRDVDDRDVDDRDVEESDEDDEDTKINNFVVLVATYNTPKWIGKCLDSILGQKYDTTKFRICVVDDASTAQKQIEILKEYEKNELVTIIYKKRNEGGLKAYVDATAYMKPRSDDIVVHVDGDDWLYNSNVLAKVNRRYQDRTLLTYGSYEIYAPHNSDNGELGICEECPADVKVFRKYRQHKWIFSHLRTFKFKLWNKIKDIDLKDEKGTYWKVSWDRAFMYPMLEMANGNIKFIKDKVYVYNMANPFNDFRNRKEEQELINLKISQLPIYDEVDF